MHKKILPIFLMLVTVGLFASVIQKTSQKIDQPFPGYLTFENGVVGAFYVSDWVGPKMGLTYHKIPSTIEQVQHPSFSKRDYFHVVILPAVSGLLFFLLGMMIFFYLTGRERYPLLFLHFLAGNYLILCPDFHLTYQYSYLLMILFALIPAAAIRFSLLFPEQQRLNRRWYVIPYIVSLLLAIPYLGWFRNPVMWIKAEIAVFIYLVIAYLFWIYRLIVASKQPQLEYSRIIARYLLLGQLIAFSIPAIVAIAIVFGGYTFPLNLAAPLALLFPISVFMGVILARLRQSQIQLIQSEKNAALGNLLAGLAHEINNPMTFVYSSMEPLKEMIQELKTKPNAETWASVDQLLSVVEEGATRSKDIIESFRYFSHPDQKESQAVDVHAVINQSLELLKPKWKDRIEIQKHYGNIPLFHGQTTELGQIFVNLISNACYAIRDKGKIEIVTGVFQNQIIVSIKDNGVGMNKDTMGKIFDAFYTTREQGQGTGLGLSITLGLVRKYGGMLEVKTEINKGSEFIVKLPVQL